MNCTDIARLLDTNAAPDPASRTAVELDDHIASCAQCADQVLAARSVARLRRDVPPLPAGLQATARRLQQRNDEPVARASRRPVLISSLLLLGAAATMFAVVPGPDDRATT
jgi:anti-sigma factor RsiW